MSTVMEKDQRSKRGFFLRKSSLQKIKCSAYPLLGSILSKDSSFIHLLENAMNSSRSVIQKPVIVLVIPTVQILCVTMAICVNLIRKLTGGVSYEQLDKFIAEINQLKSKHSPYFAQTEINLKIGKQIKEKISSENGQLQSEARDEDVAATDNRLRDEFVEQKWKPSDKNLLLRLSAFVAVSLVYIQFTILLYLIGQTQLRAGFIFLLACALTISSLVLKISFINSPRVEKRLTRRHPFREAKAMNLARPNEKRSRSRENCLNKEKSL